MSRNPIQMRIDSAAAVIEEIANFETRNRSQIVLALDELINHAQACKKNVETKMEKEKNEKRNADNQYEPSGD